jgi:MarR family transcriptional regulator, organic hydroperoxide resistance regulator
MKLHNLLCNMTDFIQKKGVAALGTRLRRLSERLDRDVREIYVAQGVTFEASWFPVIAALHECGPLSVTELADITGVSQPAISQIRKRIEAAGYVQARAAEIDLRRHELSLTNSGRRLVDTLTPVWQAVAEASAALCRDAAPNLLQELDALERQLDAAPMHKRVAKKLNQHAKDKSPLKARRAK